METKLLIQQDFYPRFNNNGSELNQDEKGNYILPNHGIAFLGVEDQGFDIPLESLINFPKHDSIIINHDLTSTKLIFKKVKDTKKYSVFELLRDNFFTPKSKIKFIQYK